MEKLFGSLVVQFREFYKSLTPTKKMALMVSTLMVFVTIGVIITLVSQKTYLPLFRNVKPEQLPTIVNSLRTKNIPYKLEDGGKSIFVPSELLHATQMAIMTETGSEQMGAVGLEIFEKQDFGTTSYAQRINFQRALQGELVRAINTLAAVSKSKVLLAIPPKKTFLEEGGQPTASVVVELHSGKILTSEQVRGITHLVSSAVENLEAEKVSVVDSRGKVLSRDYNTELGASSEILDMQKRLENHMQERIESILSRVVGSGKVIARVSATLNPQEVDTLEELYDSDKIATKSVQKEEEKMDGSRTNPTGIPGARATLPGAQENGKVGFQQNTNREISTTNYEVPKTVRKIREGAGQITKLSVAVLVDGVTKFETLGDGSLKESYIQRTPEELQKYEEIVKKAIGFQGNRGDAVKIENIRFQKEDFTESERLLTTMERKKLIYSLFRWAALACVVGIFFFIIVRPFMKWITDSFQDSVEDMLPKTIEELEELQAVDNSLPGMQGALPVLEESMDPDKAESELLRERIMTLMERDQEKSANAFQLWLNRRD